MRSFFYWLVQEVSIFTWIVTIALDLSWNLLDGVSIFSVVGIICYPIVMGIIFTVCFITVTLIQHFLSGDEWRSAMKKGAIFGVLAALPFSIITFIAGALGLIEKGSRSQESTQAYGELALNYRELEKTIKHAAIRAGKRNGSWREIPMETAINTLEQAGKFSAQEARELHELRIARNTAYHDETPANLSLWVDQSARLLQKYQQRFGAV
jgi:hypothetical protein